MSEAEWVSQEPQSMMAMVLEFHERFGLPRQPVPGTNAVPGEVAALRWALLDEEVRELERATDDGSTVKIADALADLVYVLYGTAVTYGIDLNAVLAEVHRSNMTKTANPHGGKVLKGADYQVPDVRRVIMEQEALF